MVCIIAGIMQVNCTTRAVQPKTEKFYDVCLNIIILYTCRRACFYVLYTASRHTLAATVVQRIYFSMLFLFFPQFFPLSFIINGIKFYPLTE